MTALDMVAVAAFDSGLGFLYDELAVHGETMKETSCILYQLQGSRNQRFLTPEVGTDRLSRNIDMKLPLLAA